MSKRVVVSATLILALSAPFTIAAPVTKIEFPLVAQEVKDHDVVDVDLGSLNEALHEEGLPGFPAMAVLGKKDVKWAKKLVARTQKAAKALKRDLHLFAYGKSGLYIDEVPQPFCYRGKASDVPGIIQALTGVVFHLDQGIQAIRYGKKKIIFQDYKSDFIDTNPAVRADDEQNNPNAVAAWDNYDEESATVLVMSDWGPQGDGTELLATEIKPCL